MGHSGLEPEANGLRRVQAATPNSRNSRRFSTLSGVAAGTRRDRKGHTGDSLGEALSSSEAVSGEAPLPIIPTITDGTESHYGHADRFAGSALVLLTGARVVRYVPMACASTSVRPP